MSLSRWTCCLETQMHDDVMLSGVFRYLFKACCQATADTKPIERFMTQAKSQFAQDPRVARQIINSLRENNFYLFIFLIYISECQNYVSRNNAGRKITNTAYHGYCDSGIGPGWFRFEGSAGIRMPTSCQPTNRCGTHITNWKNGRYPQQQMVRSAGRCVFTELQVVVNFQQKIKVRNCGSYYVFYLNGVPTCYSLYCGTD